MRLSTHLSHPEHAFSSEVGIYQDSQHFGALVFHLTLLWSGSRLGIPGADLSLAFGDHVVQGHTALGHYSSPSRQRLYISYSRALYSVVAQAM